MPDNPSRSLLNHIVNSIIAPAARKKLFRAPYIPFRRYLGCYQEAFEIGAVLGYAYRKKIVTFAKLFSQPGREAGFVSAIQQLARERLATQLIEPESFIHLAMFAEETRIKANWQASGITESQIRILEDSFKIPVVETALVNLNGAVSVGIGLGSAFPELTEKLWKNEHKRPVSRERWHSAKASGIVTEDEPTDAVSLPERQEELVKQVEQFISIARPDLLPTLQI